MIARYILCWLWGAALSCGWWATILYKGVPMGPNQLPFVGVVTVLGSLATLVVVFALLISSSIDVERKLK